MRFSLTQFAHAGSFYKVYNKGYVKIYPFASNFFICEKDILNSQPTSIIILSH